MTLQRIPGSEPKALRAKTMVIRKGRIGQPEADFSPVEGAAAISLLTQLTRESFSLAGLPVSAELGRGVPVRLVARSR